VTADLADFDLYGPLPSGTTVLEASAGTGKTFAIATLAVRHLAAGIPPDQLLIVTFTRAATGELRDRVRERLMAAALGLRLVTQGAQPADQLVALLSSQGDAATATHLDRLTTAAAAFDTATITTTHGFCGLVLGGLGTAGDLGSGWRLVENVDELTDEVVDDLYLRHYLRPRPSGPAPMLRADAGRAARMAVGNPRTAIAPGDGEAERGGTADLLARLARACRSEVYRRRLSGGTLGYDDLLTRLCETLESPGRGPAAARRLRERHRVVLVDEFQDTDPVQWDILRRAFDGTTDLVLIGDPKQAIYAFRGGDVHAYLAARRTATTRATLGVNWRSDQGLIDVLGTLFNGVALGHPDIVARPVRAAPDHRDSGITGLAHPQPVRFRILRRADHRGLLNLKAPTFQMDRALRAVARDLAADVASALAGGATVGLARHGLLARHIAVLVDRHEEAELMQRALLAQGVPTVIGGSGPVLATPSAHDWLTLLAAVELPSSRRRARAAALTPFVGWSPARLAAAGDAELDELTGRFHRWAELLARRGVAVLMETIIATEDLPARLLASPDGERRLTDLRHVAELLHRQSTAVQLGTAALTTWLRHRIAQPDADVGDSIGSRRLDSDAEAVQVLTVHRSKGLEFPIVYLPCLWRVRSPRSKEILTYHDPTNSDRRTIDVGGEESPDRDDHFSWASEEQRGEDLRKAYVALTRARHQVVVWWLAAQDTAKSALTRLVFSGPDPSGSARPTDDGFEAALRERLTSVAEQVEIVRVTATDAALLALPAPAGPTLRTRRFDRSLDGTWRRTSYTAITARIHGAVHPEPIVGEEAGPPGTDDEWLPTTAALDFAPGHREQALRAVRSPMADLRGGAAFGTMIHATLEHIDFASGDLPVDLAAGLTRGLQSEGTSVDDLDATVAALVAAIETPLGAALGQRSLRSVASADRLDELSFEMPLVGGERPAGETAEIAVGDIAALWRRRVPRGDPLGSYPDRLEDPLLAGDLRGYLTGSIDAVLRISGVGPERSTMFTIVDYKTNWLGVGDEPLSAWHYRPAALAETMQRAHYPLQAMLYLTALHRFLRWRVAGYQPDEHLGPVLYLFLRGMTGPDNPEVDGVPCGVFAWQPPLGMVAELSDLLDGGDRRRSPPQPVSPGPPP